MMIAAYDDKVYDGVGPDQITSGRLGTGLGIDATSKRVPTPIYLVAAAAMSFVGQVRTGWQRNVG